jgi:hypothetical protein
MKLFKFFVFLLTFAIYLLPSSAHAQDEFSVDSNVSYKVEDSGKTVVTHDITLENNFSTLYATNYTLSLENIDVQNPVATTDKGIVLPLQLEKDGDKTNLRITFSDAVVGRGAKRHFFVTYSNAGFAVRTGEIWEISIPRLSDENSFRNYSVFLSIPNSFGLEAYISPKPRTATQDASGRSYSFSKDEIIATGITAGFGEFQVFTFNLAYHLENPLSRSTQTQIALPPDTAFQKIYLQKITPKPLTVNIDEDGNWLATYKLAPRERIDVMVTGSVQIFSSYRSFPRPSQEVLSDNLKETSFWQVNDPQIKALATSLRTPRAIYDYVSQNLSYNFDRVQPNVQRFGAKKALENPSQAICMEFTDLFIALARAAGIPAREINGFAYTENKELQPLSLVADVLHSWPEYYDKQKGAWIPVDPTWGSTTGGEDFFNKLDLRHFTFVIHGEDSIKPYAPGSYKLGPNPQKDVFVSFGKLAEIRTSTPELTEVPKRTLPFLDSIYTVKIYNPGPVALYAQYATVYFDNKERSRDFINVLTPYSTYEIQVRVPFSLLGKDTPNKVKVVVDGSQIEIETNKAQVVINSLLTICGVFILLIILLLIKLKKINLSRITGTIRSEYGRFTRKISKNSNKP